MKRLSKTYTLMRDGIYRPDPPIRHRDEEFNQAGFDVLLKMQERHFWYRGRHRFLLDAVQRRLSVLPRPLSAVDLGGGVGGWLKYLENRLPGTFSKLALADSSLKALKSAGEILPPGTERYQVDLMDLGWENAWDMAFLLDVLEHLHDDVRAVRETAKALRPGGLLFVTSPAFPFFWSYNDEAGSHLRRYVREDMEILARKSGLTLLDVRYFMFFLSPLYWVARKRNTGRSMSQAEMCQVAIKAHQIPPRSLNELLAAVFALETPLGHIFPFPWGTSILGVFQKP